MNFDEVVKLMDDRKYGVQSYSSDKNYITFIKVFMLVDFFILADVNVKAGTIQLFHVTDDFIKISTGDFSLYHKDFKDFEKRIYNYIYKMEAPELERDD